MVILNNEKKIDYYNVSVHFLVCGGILNTPGEIKLPTYHDHRINKLTYAGALNCLWNITAPKNKNVVLK